MTNPKQEDVPTADEVSVIQTEDGQNWININDLLGFVDYIKTVFGNEAKEAIKNADTLAEKDAILMEKEIYEAMFKDVAEALEDINSQDEIES